MWLNLTDDDGIVFRRWYIDERDHPRAQLAQIVEDEFAVWDTKEEATSGRADSGQ